MGSVDPQGDPGKPEQEKDRERDAKDSASIQANPANGGSGSKDGIQIPLSNSWLGMGGADRETTDMALFVRTSSETLSDWNRQRIVDALLRETTIDLETADGRSPEDAHAAGGPSL
jgi:hypothetical protein